MQQFGFMGADFPKNMHLFFFNYRKCDRNISKSMFFVFIMFVLRVEYFHKILAKT